MTTTPHDPHASGTEPGDHLPSSVGDHLPVPGGEEAVVPQERVDEAGAESVALPGETPVEAVHGDEPAAEPEPTPDAAAVPAPSAVPAADGYVAPAISAAKAAADFVAQIFAEVNAPDTTEPSPLLAVPVDAPDGEAEPAQPLGRPGEGMLPFEGQHFLVLGLGASGLAMARWCVRCGATVTVADTRAAPPQLSVLQQELPGVRFVAGPFDANLVEGGAGVHAVYRSPGLSPATVAPVWAAAQAIGLATGGELGLYAAALQYLRASHGYAPAVLAITGTNGKTTVTSLTGQLVERAGKTVAVAGNIGPTLLDTLAGHIDADTLPEVWVLELSSFQLDGATGFEPTAATVLNITQDHLDWHGDIAAYAGAKARIFGDTALMVLNRDDPTVMDMLGSASAAAAQAAQAAALAASGKPAPTSRSKLPAKVPLREHLSFGIDMPRRPGDFGMEIVGGMPWLVRALEADETRKRSTRRRAVVPAQGDAAAVAVAMDEEDLHIQRLMPADALRIRGRHNASNALAALALASSAGCTLSAMLFGLREYRGEPHRVEPVALIDGVEYFDDSKGTNVGATVAALNGLGADRRIVLILGGDGKGQDFAPLATPVSRYARAVVLIGRDAPLIRTALHEAGVTLLDAATLPEAVHQAAQRARSGDAVLMSPACASFDMFTGYEHRARVFCDTVLAMAQDAGQSLEGM
ncbi:UDP-N-acetylmuramoyl-L-alanine--D-glutamate ligase [Acidovorax sp. LjRoot118]|uniref:Mur ligase family protein n=1 Tax=Acidovorax sp. LjRoot118 TaxID=3342256 RepID=UPI003ED0C9C8